LTLRQYALVLTTLALAACGGTEPVAPSNAPPARLNAVTDLSRTAAVGTVIPNAIVVTVTDSSGRAVQGVAVAFAVTAGNGSTSPRIATTDVHGQATASWTLGTIVGANEVTASVTGVASPIKFTATGTAGPVTTISLSTQNARLLANVDTLRLSAKALDAFGNVTSPAPTFTVRDVSLVSIDAGGLVHALKRGSGTYIVATAGNKSDSTLVTVLAPGQSACTAAATPVSMAVGQVLTDVSPSGVCVHADSPNAEYALVPFFDAAQPSSVTTVEVHPFGIAPLPVSAAALRRPVAPSATSDWPQPDEQFEAALRERERVESAKRPFVARRAMSANRNLVGASAPTTVPAVGDIMKLNANAVDFCTNPDFRIGRVMAVTNKAIIVADTANPPGGFTVDEFKSIGATFDSQINPIDSAAFGNVTDIDNNGHVILFFTRAVNELTPQGSPSGVFLGFYYRRDLYPRTGSADGDCPGSNQAEMFYLIVPDTGALINGNRRTKQQVVVWTNGTVAHEYQHLINAAGRMYGPNPNGVFEEKWLDEGLAHIAEDLNFWAASGMKPRTNADVSLFNDPHISDAYGTYANNNMLRYARYLANTATQAPLGSDANDDDLQTRGAIWSLLRYLADQKFGASENTLWNALANSRTAGMANLAAALGTAPNSMIRDWAISVLMDDNAPGVDPRFTQPSWNSRSIISAGGLAYPLVTRTLSDGVTGTMTLDGDGVTYLRFSVPNGQDALFTVTSSNGQPLAAGVRLAVVRTK